MCRLGRHSKEWPFLIYMLIATWTFMYRGCRMIRYTYLCRMHVLIKPISSFTIRPPTINHDHRPPRWILTSRKSGKNVCISTRECTFARRVTQPDIPILFFDVTFAQKPKGRQIFKTAPPSSSSATAWRKNNYLQYIRVFFAASPLEIWVGLLQKEIFLFLLILEFGI